MNGVGCPFNYSSRLKWWLCVCSLELLSSLGACPAAVHEFRIPPKALLGLHSYCPVHFDALHTVLVDVTVHISLLKASSSTASLKVPIKLVTNSIYFPLYWRLYCLFIEVTLDCLLIVTDFLYFFTKVTCSIKLFHWFLWYGRCPFNLVGQINYFL